jgi:epoxyqueuosine reductase
MSYIGRLEGIRLDPRELLPGAASVVCAIHNYASAADPRPPDGAPRIARYARGRDYHRVLRKKLARLAAWIEERVPGARTRLCVDTAPLLEKAWAERAGLGWRGKHTNLVVRSRGSWTFLGAIVTDVSMEPDARHLDFCGSCTRCLDVCPTRAFPEPYVLDARRCISYLTIEHRGEFTREEGAGISDHLFGCDRCLEVCPWNSFGQPTAEPDFEPRAEVVNRSAEDWAELDEAEYDRLLSGSAMRRATREGLRRNAREVLRNRSAGTG